MQAVLDPPVTADQAGRHLSRVAFGELIEPFGAVGFVTHRTLGDDMDEGL